MANFPKRALGQVFLRDDKIAQEIVKLLRVNAGDTIVEIGPGRGALTRHLVETPAKIVAVEKDEILSAALREKYHSRSNLEIRSEDILRFDFASLRRPDGAYIVVGNLPYNISSQILFRLLDDWKLFTRWTLMFQLEVAERVVSGPGTRKYGIPSVITNLYTDPQIERIVSPGSFFPKPKVNSAIVSFRLLKSPRVDIDDEAYFRRVVKAAFVQRRKTISNSLISSGLVGKDVVFEVLESAGIGRNLRSEQLDLKGFHRLYRALRSSQ